MRILTLLTVTALLAACGGGGSSSSSFSNPPDITPPDFSAIGDVTITANETSQPIAFTVQDDRSGSVQLSATSGDANLVDDSGLSVELSGTAATLVITPNDNVTGTVTITVSATDQAGNSAETSFTATIEEQQIAASQFVRDVFAVDANGEPLNVSSITVIQDVDDPDAFQDLLGND